MTDVVERVARALCRYEIGDEALWKNFRTAARAAIAAMREPTDAMLSAGDSMMPQIAKGEDITTGYDALKEAWPTMIDAALAPDHLSGER